MNGLYKGEKSISGIFKGSSSNLIHAYLGEIYINSISPITQEVALEIVSDKLGYNQYSWMFMNEDVFGYYFMLFETTEVFGVSKSNGDIVFFGSGYNVPIINNINNAIHYVEFEYCREGSYIVKANNPSFTHEEIDGLTEDKYHVVKTNTVTNEIEYIAVDTYGRIYEE